ncbi:shikimate kinase [Burkholderia cepacia]|uniref:shikimate kinase n=1 Tax=Burkholderia TaxID=32008 RepID=UPI0008ABFB20|nr:MULTISPECIES: shikimate kinase [Burkholderia]MCA7981812.1 shikimate kinase [Burkholderia cepacia]MCR5895535.1 shikimate kinase [Burkholderia sp. HAN2018]MDC6102967.1 shikimate kinase [Burkholderia cepacia]MDN7915611.1 shikimate kinase [Burkholderia cepacia]NLA19588.1 AAA family ATPase [Burkholderia cepacia]
MSHAHRQHDDVSARDTAGPSHLDGPETIRESGCRICLVGLMGTGKTTVGRHLAQHLSIDFVDADALLEARLGYPIRECFARDGERVFRDRESNIIEEIARRPEVVLSTGGGAVLCARTRSTLKRRFTVVHLTATVEEIHARTRHDPSRPLLQTDDPIATLQSLLLQRQALYEACADLTVDTTARSVPAIAMQLARALRSVDVHDPDSSH